MNQFEVFVQGSGLRETQAITLEGGASLRQLVERAYALGLERREDLILFHEDDVDEGDEPLCGDHGRPIVEIIEISLVELEIPHGHTIHLHHHKEIAVTVNFLEKQVTHRFRPGTTVGKVLRWSTGKLKIQPVDAVELGLFLCGQKEKAEDDETHLGTIAGHAPSVCFTLAPKERVQG